MAVSKICSQRSSITACALAERAEAVPSTGLNAARAIVHVLVVYNPKAICHCQGKSSSVLVYLFYSLCASHYCCHYYYYSCVAAAEAPLFLSDTLSEKEHSDRTYFDIFLQRPLSSIFRQSTTRLRPDTLHYFRVCGNCIRALGGCTFAQCQLRHFTATSLACVQRPQLARRPFTSTSIFWCV